MRISWLAEIKASTAPIASVAATLRHRIGKPQRRDAGHQQRLHQQQPAPPPPPEQAAAPHRTPAPIKISAYRPGRYWRSARSRPAPRCSEASHIRSVNPESASGRPEENPSAVISARFFAARMLAALLIDGIVDVIGLAERAADTCCLHRPASSRPAVTLPLQNGRHGHRPARRTQFRLQAHMSAGRYRSASHQSAPACPAACSCRQSCISPRNRRSSGWRRRSRRW